MRRLAALAAAALAVSLATRASAYCRTTTVKIDDPSYSPVGGQCWDKGVPLWWKNSCVGYSIQRDGSRQVAYDDASNAIARAFTRWTGASCPAEPGSPSRASIDVRDLGPVNCGAVQQNRRGANQNVIVFRDTVWPHNDKDNTLALTTVSFDKNTGELLGADIEVNTAEKRVSLTDPVPFDGYDFESIMTHEVGHFLGLAHSDDSKATMFARYDPGTTVIRNLGTDDIGGICAAYPPNGTRTVGAATNASGSVPAEACDPTPQGGFSTECGGEAPANRCAAAPVGMARGGAASGLAVVVACGVGLGRRRRRALPRATKTPGGTQNGTAC